MEKTILANHHDYIANPSKKSLPALINKNVKEVPEALRNFKYPISSWPVILSKEEVEELAACSVLIPKLTQQIPEVYFKNDLTKIADFYYGGDQVKAEFANFCNQKKVPISCRLDLIKAATGFQVLEVNTGSSLSGMEIQNFKSVIDVMHPELNDEKLALKVRNTQQIYIDFIIQKAIELLSDDEDEITIFMVEMISTEEERLAYSDAEKFYNKILNEEIAKYHKKGKVVINGMTEVSLQNNKLMYNNERVHVVLIRNYAIKDISPDIFRAFMMNKIYFPDHFGVEMLGDKRNLVILRTLADEGKFTPEENAQIQKFIPWSVLLKETSVSYNGTTHDLQTLLKEQKDNFVIKVADGLQGTDVFVGKTMSAAAWAEAIKKATEAANYIVQEFVDSDYIYVPNKQNQWAPHSLIWGAFGFGDIYGGTWVRMSAKENTSRVINSATGAVEAIVYEETTDKNEIHTEKESMTATILGDAYENLMVDSPKKIPTFVDATSEKLPEFLRGYEYPVSSWPVIIDWQQRKNLEQLCTKIPKLLTKIPALYFENDMKRIGDFYFQGDDMMTQFAIVCHEKQIEIACRLDLSLDTDGFKILEANIGSSIGGWQVQSFETIIRDIHPNLDENFSTEDTQANYIDFLVKNVIKHVSYLQKDINIFLALGEYEEGFPRAEITSFFNNLLEKSLQDTKFKGNTFIGEFTETELKNNRLVFEGEDMHAALEIVVTKAGVPLNIFRAFMLDAVYFPDHLASGMYGDKRNLGILRELAENNKFSALENELIIKSIPWTKEIKDSIEIYKGEKMHIREILKNNKENMVVKAAQGYQGKDVFIGRFSSDVEWNEAIELALKDKNFIAQEFSDSIKVLAPNKENEWTPHKLIWGAFGFGNKYGGVWVRTSEVANDIGVINSATGAVESIVYEHHLIDEITI
ncbi:glutathione synthetase [Kordia sp. SMS9]|uniref:hypothetical protein n=1 Tax=Kordia sp. SMS9 TaxID=2282170 RepID=UPI000E0D7DB7|nr:hypothetical protein [Kordia sp. SMS9]AXG70741.1 glutathione synthetase [Kordia sp. SMS9]